MQIDSNSLKSDFVMTQLLKVVSFQQCCFMWPICFSFAFLLWNILTKSKNMLVFFKNSKFHVHRPKRPVSPNSPHEPIPPNKSQTRKITHNLVFRCIFDNNFEYKNFLQQVHNNAVIKGLSLFLYIHIRIRKIQIMKQIFIFLYYCSPTVLNHTRLVITCDLRLHKRDNFAQTTNGTFLHKLPTYGKKSIFSW